VYNYTRLFYGLKVPLILNYSWVSDLKRHSKEIMNKRICHSNNCNKCDKYAYEVPESCDYSILHLLDEVKLEWRERRSGKTSGIVKMANNYKYLNKNVMIIFKSLEMAGVVKQTFKVDREVRLVSINAVMTGNLFRGIRVGGLNVFMDEVSPIDYFRMEEKLIDCNIIKGFFT
jgi:hypothetical protein